MKLYHRTTNNAAAAIMANGFRDGSGTYGTGTQFSGVWLSNVPLDENEGATGDALLEVIIDGRTIAHYEWKQEPAFGYREWLIPASIVNQRGRARQGASHPE